MKVDEIAKTFRTLGVEDCPESQGYSCAAIYKGNMGPGGLYLATQALPAVYGDGTGLSWWTNLIQQTGYMDVRGAKELEDETILWDDGVLHSIEQGGSAEDAERNAAQIAFRQEGMPCLTHFVLCAEKKAQQGIPTGTDKPCRRALGVADNEKIGVETMQKQLTAIIEREGDGYVSLCPGLDIASQGDTIEEAHENLREAVELFFESASPEEIRQRSPEEIYVTRVEVAIG